MGTFVVLAPPEHWMQQARAAWEEPRQHAHPGMPLRDLQSHNPDAFSRLVGALVALGHQVSQEPIDLAGPAPIDAVIWND